MNLHVSEFIGGEIVAAYTTMERPSGQIVGRSGNAVLLRDGDKDVVVSAPRAQCDVVAMLGAHNAPVVDLSARF